uniref:Uncharacterized protein n=1 Tax=Micrurus lemniscatus lemniscatus TaxID=129467 RepID=A0A2D4J5B3_MICLE
MVLKITSEASVPGKYMYCSASRRTIEMELSCIFYPCYTKSKERANIPSSRLRKVGLASQMSKKKLLFILALLFALNRKVICRLTHYVVCLFLTVSYNWSLAF